MANKKISLLTELTSPANGDFIPIVDTSTSQTKKISYSSLITALNTDDDSYSKTEVDSAFANITSVGTLTSLTVAGDITIDSQTLTVDSSNDRVGVGAGSAPLSKLHIRDSSDGNLVRQLRISNESESDGTGAGIIFNMTQLENPQVPYINAAIDSFKDSSRSGNLVFSTRESNTGGDTAVIERMRINGSGEVGIGKAATSGVKLDVNGTIKGTALEVSTGNTELKGNVTIPNANKSITKQKCYNKTGAIRLQRSASDSEEVLLRYEGANSDDFVIQQYHGGSSVKRGQIKFLGVLPNSHENAGESGLRLDAENIDVGFTGTNLTKIYSDTNLGSLKKFVFKDSRDATDGLHFEHSGTGCPTMQLGMYGNFGDSDFGQFKITHTDSSSANTNVIVVDKDNGFTKLESGYTEVKNLKVANQGYAQFGSLTTTQRNALTAANGMVIYNTTDNKFQGYENGAWVNLV